MVLWFPRRCNATSMFQSRIASFGSAACKLPEKGRSLRTSFFVKQLPPSQTVPLFETQFRSLKLSF
jgi:hypothetical protein